MQQILEDLSGKYPQFLFIHADVDDMADDPEVHGFVGVPTIIIQKNGEEMLRLTGVNEDRLEQVLGEL